jgi:hypothetical protein
VQDISRPQEPQRWTLFNMTISGGEDISFSGVRKFLQVVTIVIESIGKIKQNNET